MLQEIHKQTDREETQRQKNKSSKTSIFWLQAPSFLGVFSVLFHSQPPFKKHLETSSYCNLYLFNLFINHTKCNIFLVTTNASRRSIVNAIVTIFFVNYQCFLVTIKIRFQLKPQKTKNMFLNKNYKPQSISLILIKTDVFNVF
jgi:hypothetical protein